MPASVLGIEVRGTPIALYRVDGAIYATHDLCTHGHARLQEGYLDGCLMECPLHSGHFDVRTGRGAGTPITQPVRTYAVRVEDESLLVRLD